MSKTIEKRIKSNIPYDIKMRVDGKYDYVGVKRFSEDEPTVNLSLGEEYDYDGLRISSEETPNAEPFINSQGTILPWKYEYKDSLTTNNYCLMPFGKMYQSIERYEHTLEENFSQYGALSIGDDYEVSGFASDKYLRIKTIDFGSNDYEIVFKFKIANYSSEYQYMFFSMNNCSFNIAVTNTSDGSVIHSNSGNGSSWYTPTYGNKQIQLNKEYLVKVIRNNGVRTVYLSENNGETWSEEGFVADTYSYVDSFKFGSNPSGGQVFNGSVYIKDCYIKINNELVWEGVTDKGLEQKYKNNLPTTYTGRFNNGLLSYFDGTCKSSGTTYCYKFNDFELRGKFKTSFDVTTFQRILFFSNMELDLVNTNKLRWCFYFNGKWNYYSGDFAVQPYTWYWVRAIYYSNGKTVDGKTYDAKTVYGEYSLDGENWITIGSANLNSKFLGTTSSSTSTSFYGTTAFGQGISSTDGFFTGLIDSKECGYDCWSSNGGHWYFYPAIKLSDSYQGCTYNYYDNGSETTLNVFTRNMDNQIILSPNDSIPCERKLGTIRVPQHTPRYYIDGKWVESTILEKDKDYDITIVGAGGGGSAYDGGAGAYWRGIVTPNKDIPVTVKLGAGGFKNKKGSLNNNASDGEESSIIGEGLSIVCPGGQGSLSKTNDLTGDLSVHTYAPQVNITDAQVFEIGTSTNGVRKISWLGTEQQYSSSNGGGGDASPGDAYSGTYGESGIADYNDKVYSLNINVHPSDANCVINISGSNNLNYSVNGTTTKFPRSSMITLTGSKEGYETTTKNLGYWSTNCNYDLYLMTGTWLDSEYYINNLYSTYYTGEDYISLMFNINGKLAASVADGSTITIFSDSTHSFKIKRDDNNENNKKIQILINDEIFAYTATNWSTMFSDSLDGSFDTLFLLTKEEMPYEEYPPEYRLMVYNYQTKQRYSLYGQGDFPVWDSSLIVNEDIYEKTSGFTIKYFGFTSRNIEEISYGSTDIIPFTPNLLSYKPLTRYTLTITPNPVDATVEMSTNGSTYEERTSLEVPELSIIYYRVYKEGYMSISDKILIDSNLNKTVTLYEGGITGLISNIVDGSNFEVSSGVIRSGSASYNVNSGKSYKYFEYTPTVDTELVISASVSSESSYDYFGCYVGTALYNATQTQVKNKTSDGNGSWLFSISGLVDQSGYSMTLTAGTHYYIQFYYVKDSSVNKNDDRGYIYGCNL